MHDIQTVQLNQSFYDLSKNIPDYVMRQSLCWTTHSNTSQIGAQEVHNETNVLATALGAQRELVAQNGQAIDVFACCHLPQRLSFEHLHRNIMEASCLCVEDFSGEKLGRSAQR